MASWLSDASANRHIKTYVKDFLDVSGNMTVRNGDLDIDHPTESMIKLTTDTDGSNGLQIYSNSAGSYVDNKENTQIRFRTNDTDRVTITNTGRLGIGNTNPSSTLDVNGAVRSAYNSNTMSYFGRTALGGSGNYSDYAYFSHVDMTDSGNYALLQASTGSTMLNCKNGQSTAIRCNNGDKMVFRNDNKVYLTCGSGHGTSGVHYWFCSLYNGVNGQVEFVGNSGSNQTRLRALSFNTISDDRMKINETLLTNATDTLMKLKPQLYDEYINEHDKVDTRKGVGLIAQEIYYNAPELRPFVVQVPLDPSGNEVTPVEADLMNVDLQNDPDYDALGWSGPDKNAGMASVNYSSFIPYLIKSNQEQQALIDSLIARVTALENK